MTSFSTATPSPELPEELTLWLTRAIAYWAGELTPEEQQRLEGDLPRLSEAEREIFEEVRTLFQALEGQAGALTPSREVWDTVRARVQDDLAWLTAVRRASGEFAGSSLAGVTSDEAGAEGREPRAGLQAGVEEVFAAATAAPRLQPSRDLLASLRAELGRGEGAIDERALASQPQPAGGRVSTLRQWLGAGAVATFAAAAALMLAVGLGLLERPGTGDGSDAESGGGATSAAEEAGVRSDNGSGAAGENRGQSTPGESTEADPDSHTGEGEGLVDAPANGGSEAPPREEGGNVEHAPQPFAPAFIRFDLDQQTPAPETSYLADRQQIRFFATKIDRWPLSFDMPEPPQRLVLGKGVEGARLALPTTEGNLHLRRGREPGVLEIYHDNEPNRRTIIRSEGTIDLLLTNRHRATGQRRPVVPYSVRFTHDPQVDAWYAVSASMMVSHTPVAGRRLILFDAELNGRFDGYGTDLVLFADSPSAMVLSEVIAVGDQAMHLSVAPGGMEAEIAPYEGTTGELEVRGDYRDSVALDYVHLRSSHTSLLVEAGQCGRSLTVPAGRYEIVHGRVSGDNRSLWLDTFEGRDLGELVAAEHYHPGDAQSQQAQPYPPGAVTVHVGESGQEKALLRLGGALTLRPFEVASERTQEKRLPLQLALLGQAGERYRPLASLGPEPLLPETAEIRLRHSGERLGRAELEPSQSTLLPFVAELSARGAHPEAEHDLHLVEHDASVLLRGHASEVVLELR